MLGLDVVAIGLTSHRNCSRSAVPHRAYSFHTVSSSSIICCPSSVGGGSLQSPKLCLVDCCQRRHPITLLSLQGLYNVGIELGEVDETPLAGRLSQTTAQIRLSRRRFSRREDEGRLRVLCVSVTKSRTSVVRRASRRQPEGEWCNQTTMRGGRAAANDETRMVVGGPVSRFPRIAASCALARFRHGVVWLSATNETKAMMMPGSVRLPAGSLPLRACVVCLSACRRPGKCSLDS